LASLRFDLLLEHNATKSRVSCHLIA